MLKETYPSVYTYTPDKKFNEPREGRQTMEDFIQYFEKSVNSVLNGPYKNVKIYVQADPVNSDPDDEFGFSETVTNFPNIV